MFAFSAQPALQKHPSNCLQRNRPTERLHRTGTNDPLFVEKLRDVVGLYVEAAASDLGRRGDAIL
jgi:hypothetical protein